MLTNLYEFFVPRQEYYLENISYRRIENINVGEEHSLTCTNNITVGLGDSGVKITLTRILSFDPEEMFELSVAFGAELSFDEAKKNTVDWQKINLAEEFRDNGGFVLNNLSNRISLLIAEITSSFGQTPLILSEAITDG